MIYEEVFPRETVTIQVAKNTKRSVVCQGLSVTGPPPLLATCRQIRAEASNPYHSRSRFNIMVPAELMAMSVKWLYSIKARNRRLLQHVDICLMPNSGGSSRHSQTGSGTSYTYIMEQPRWLVLKFRQSVLQMLEALSIVRNLKHKVIAFHVDGLEGVDCTNLDWTHVLIDELQCLRAKFREAGLALGCECCGYIGVLRGGQWRRTSVEDD